jgi:hypothetical protein
VKLGSRLRISGPFFLPIILDLLKRFGEGVIERIGNAAAEDLHAVVEILSLPRRDSCAR